MVLVHAFPDESTVVTHAWDFLSGFAYRARTARRIASSLNRTAIFRRSFVVAMALVAGTPANSISQEAYPKRPIKIVVPVPPGAAADLIPRMIAEKLASRFGQPVVVENRPGANSNIGAEFVANAAPDGYTLLATPQSPLVINELFYPKLGFDPRAFVPVSVIAALPNVLVAGTRAPFATIAELLAYARANPGKLNFGSPGLGSSPHLAMEWIKHLANIQMVHVPYSGIPPILKDVMANEIDLTFANAFTVIPLISEGRLRALGVDSENRISQLPAVPTIGETFPGYVVTVWFAIMAPPKTPPEVAAKLSAAISEALNDANLAKRLHDLSAVPVGTSPLETAAFIERERQRWHELFAAARLKVD